MREQMDFLHSGGFGDHANGLFEVLHRELGRLAIDVVAEEHPLGPASGPREHHAHELAAEKMTQLTGRQHRVFERVRKPMHEHHDFLARRAAEPTLKLRLECALSPLRAQR